MNFLKKLYYNGTSVFPLRLLSKLSQANSLFPYHHIVSDQKVPHIINLYPYKNVKQFTQDLDFLLKNFTPIAPSELINFINLHNRLPSNKFLLTFDDGFREVYDVIAPILKKKGVPAIFFINPAFIDNKEMFYRNKISLLLGILEKRKEEDAIIKGIANIFQSSNASYEDCREQLLKSGPDKKSAIEAIGTLLNISFEEYLQKNKPWLTTSQLTELSAQGFDIGAHSWDHPYYQSLPLNEQLWQTIESCKFIRQFQKEPITFSFPHADANLSQQLFDELLKPENGIDLLFGTQNQKDEISNRIIHRFNCERPDIPINIQVKGMLTYTITQQLFNKRTLNRKYA